MLSMLLGAGLTIREALAIIGDELSKSILASIEKGKTFSASLRENCIALPAYIIELCSSGEALGTLESIFVQIKMILGEKEKVREKIISSLLYPCIILACLVLGIAGISIFLLPQIEIIFSGFAKDAGNEIRQNIKIIKILLFSLSGFVVFIILFFLLLKKEDRDAFVLRIPLAGRFISSYLTLNFCFTMEILCNGGFPLNQSLEKSAVSIGNAVWKDALLRIKAKTESGINVAQCFLEEKVFPGILVKWIQIGNHSQQIGPVFSQMRHYFALDIERQCENMMKLIEPAITLVVGIVTLVLIVSIILPLYKIFGTII
jgi:type II secretory pathway component PulF